LKVDPNSLLLLTVLLPAGIALMMFGLGLGLTPDDFTRLINFPKITLLGLGTKIIIMPLTALGLSFVFGLSAPFAIGLVMTAAGGASVMANVFTSMAKGNVALGLTFTAIDNLLVAVTLPAYTALAIKLFLNKDEHVGLQFADSLKIFGLIAGPVGMGMLMRKNFVNASAKLEKILRAFTLVLLVILILTIIIKERRHLIDTVGVLGFPTLLLASLGLLYGFAIARVLPFNKADGSAIIFGLPIQGTTVVASVGLAVFGDISYIIPAGIYSVFMYVVGFAGVWLLKKFAR
jgi:bile acid:Na+ symporter, BASS family